MSANIREIEAGAIAYLTEQLGDRAPKYITFKAEFTESPLEGEGPTYLFSFPLRSGGDESACGTAESLHYVAVGETTPNFFPAYGLDVDGAYSFHIGTRFMLVMKIQKVDAGLEPPTARPSLDRLLANLAPGAGVEQVELAALFRCDDDYFAVYRLEVNQLSVYCLAADCPPGFYELTHYPPQMVLRFHLGQMIRAEARGAAGRAELP